MSTAQIFDIKRFAVHDGDGIRTTVFFAGCPLRCLWCHNPEGLSASPRLACYAHKCTLCGRCAAVCPCGVHHIQGGEHLLDRSRCTACRACVQVCGGEALKLYGRTYSVGELLPLLTEDRDFYENSGGGVTLSGGECLLQPDFCAELLGALKSQGIRTAVDTCGFVPREAFDKVMPYTDIFLYDIKAIDEQTHLRYTGQSNRIILENLRYIDRCGKHTEIRIPYVPGVNDDQIAKIGEFLQTLHGITAVKILPYHSYAAAKYAALGMENTFSAHIPSDAEMSAARQILREYGLVCI